MKIKKLLILVLCFVLVASFLVSCKDEGEDKSTPDATSHASELNIAGKTPEVALKVALEILEMKKNYTLDMVANIEMTFGDQKVEMEMDIVSKYDLSDENNIKFSVATSLDTGYGETTSVIACLDGYYYAMEVKAPVTKEQAAEVYKDEGNFAEILDAELFNTINKTNNEDGSVVITVSGLKAEGENEKLDSLYQMLGLYGPGTEIKDFNITLKVNKDGIITELVIVIDVHMEEGEAGSFDEKVTLTGTFKDFGTTTVTAPEGADQYDEVEFSDIFGDFDFDDLSWED